MITLNAVTGITSPNIDSPVGDNTPATGDFTTVNISGALTAGTLNTGGGTLSPQTGFKNRIINGSMTIDQRNNGAATTPAPVNQYTVDRLLYSASQTGKFNFQQNASGAGPEGFSNYAGFTSTSAYSSTSSDFFAASQRIEGFNISDLGWGTAAAKTVTLSFWVKSSLSGLHSGALVNGSFNRSYPYSFTVSSANTWEYKTITIPGDNSGTWNTTNGFGAGVVFNLGCGSNRLGTANAWVGAERLGVSGAVSVVGTSGATFFVTGVQLERGSVATPFEFRAFNQEFNLCYRYYERRTVGSTFNERLTTTGLSTSSTGAQFPVQHLEPKRALPTINVGNLNNTNTYDGGGTGVPTSWSLDNTGLFITNIQVAGLSGTALGRAIHWSWGNSSPNPFIEISAEL